MGFFDGLMEAARSVRSRQQSQQYRKLQADARRAKMEREKARLLRKASTEKARAKRDIARTKPKRKFKFIGDLREFAGRLPSDTELNRAIFGSDSPQHPRSKPK